MEGLGVMMSNMDKVGADLDNALEDESEWETPSRSRKPKSEQRQRGAMVSVRLTLAELESVQRAAAEEGLSVAAFMRKHALQAGAKPAWTLQVSDTLRNATYWDAAAHALTGEIEMKISPYKRRMQVSSGM